MGQNSTEVAYGFGQMGSIHGKVELPLIPPKGLVIVAIQFLADNTPTKLESASTGPSGYGANYLDTETAGFFNFEGVTNDVDSTMAAETVAAGDNITIGANSKVKVGQYVLLVADGDTAGITIDSTTAIPCYERGYEAGTQVVSVNAAGTVITLDKSITFDNSQHLIFIDEHNGAGGQDASGIKYPKGLVIYGRWKSVTPSADTDGGVICYFGK